jgi:hypothetical protein
MNKQPAVYSVFALPCWSAVLVSVSACTSASAEPHAVSAFEVADVAGDEVIARCERVKSKTWPPVTCHSLYDDKAQAMVFKFATDEQVREYLMALAREVAWPFCLAANQAGRQASVLVTVADRRWRRWDCTTPDWSNWHVRGWDQAADERGHRLVGSILPAEDPSSVR